MFDDLLKLKIFDRKIYWKESVAELYKILFAESEKAEKSQKSFSQWFQGEADKDHDEASNKFAIDKVSAYWSIFFMYTSRVNFLKNIISQNQAGGLFKGKEIREFTKTADKHIETQIESFVLYMQPQLFYFFMNYIEIRHEPILANKITSLYVSAFNTSIKEIDKLVSNSASKINQHYDLEKLVINKCEQQLQTYINYSDE